MLSFWRSHIVTAFQSWVFSTDWNVHNKDGELSQLAALPLICKTALYTTDFILTIGAFVNTFSAHGTIPYILWAAILICLAFGSWILDISFRSTQNLHQRQLWYRIIRVGIAIPFRIWSHFLPTTGNTMVTKQLLAGAGCNLVAI
jgi:hypothetical protein